MLDAPPLQLAGNSTTTAVTNPTAANVAIPNGANGAKARYVLIQTDALCRFQPVQTAGAPALSAMSVLQPAVAYVVNVAGYSEIRLDKPVAGTANVTITPLENH